MNISQRLRTCARHTGLDAVIELLNEAADEIDALHARANGQATPPAEWDIWEDRERICAELRDILPLPPEQVPMTREQAMAIVQSNPDTMTAIRMTEAHHGITAQAKKEDA